MSKELKFDPIFDYDSAFNYDSIVPLSSFNRGHYRSAFTYHSINIGEDSDTDERNKEDWISIVLRKTITVFFYLFVIASFPISAWTCVKKIHALERIVLMRLGKLQAVRGPGFALILPLIDTWKRVDLRPQDFKVTSSEVGTCDGGVVEITADIVYRVSDVLNYVLKLRKQEVILKDLGSLCLKNVISEKDQDDLENKRDIICSDLKDELNRSVLNWGLEIQSVQLFPPKILKAAEPVDALGTLMIALKAATGQSTEHTAAVFPFSNGVSHEKMSMEVHDSPVKTDEDIVALMKEKIKIAENKGLLINMIANYKFEITSQSTRTIFCTFENGQGLVFEAPASEPITDMTLRITESDMRDFLVGNLSPLEAYKDGKVAITGNWSLLVQIANILE